MQLAQGGSHYVGTQFTYTTSRKFYPVQVHILLTKTRFAAHYIQLSYDIQLMQYYRQANYIFKILITT